MAVRKLRKLQTADFATPLVFEDFCNNNNYEKT